MIYMKKELTLTYDDLCDMSTRSFKVVNEIQERAQYYQKLADREREIERAC